MTPTPLNEATDPERFGGKAAHLARALRAGLPVPAGWALSVEAAAALEAEGAVPPALEQLFERGPLAVRSSATGEDGERASYAGQLISVLEVTSAAGLLDAVRRIRASGRAARDALYHRRRGGGALRVGVVLQAMVRPRAAGVMFTRHPVDGRQVRVVEASWGLGEAVVSGLVTPDRFEFAPGRRRARQEAGDKDVEITAAPDGGTERRPVPPPRRAALCLGPADLDRLDELAAACDRVWPGPHDVEFAFAKEQLHLLQRRPITAGAGR